MTTMTQPKLTGKRRSMDIKEMDYPPKLVPLVPDLSAAQKARIHEELVKSWVLTETSSVERMTSRQVNEVEPTRSNNYTNNSSDHQDGTRQESRTHRFGRKIKGFFINDQSKPPSRKESLDTRNGVGNRAYVAHDDEIDEDDLYHFDGRSKNLWGGSGI